MNLPRIAVVCDFQEENWPSMDLVAEMLLEHLQRDYADRFIATRICPPMRRRLARAPGAKGQGEGGRLFNADRFLNRFWDYPRFMRRHKSEFDLFHLVDHSYAQLLHQLPPERTVVTCHDLDTFQSLLDPVKDPRSFLFKQMMSRTLSGLRKAARVTCDSVATRDQLLAYQLVAPERAVVVTNGVHPSCSPEANAAADAEAEIKLRGKGEGGKGKGEGISNQDSELNRQSSIVNRQSSHPDILHVGSTIPRKRIDVLLRVFARVKESFPNARLLRVGGAFTAEQFALAQNLRVSDSIVVLPRVDRSVLAALYRRAALVLQPSEREGFGLPVIEALACGTPVVASDLPVLREVGGDAASYCPVANVESWSDTIVALLCEKLDEPDEWSRRRERGLVQADNFSWAEYVRKMVALYDELL